METMQNIRSMFRGCATTSTVVPAVKVYTPAEQVAAHTIQRIYKEANANRENNSVQALSKIMTMDPNHKECMGLNKKGFIINKDGLVTSEYKTLLDRVTIANGSAKIERTFLGKAVDAISFIARTVLGFTLVDNFVNASKFPLLSKSLKVLTASTVAVGSIYGVFAAATGAAFFSTATVSSAIATSKAAILAIPAYLGLV